MRQVQSGWARNQYVPPGQGARQHDYAPTRQLPSTVPRQRTDSPAGAAAPPSDSVDAYAAWASVLGEHFFGPDQNGRTVAMFVDDALAEELGASPALHGVTLYSAVHRELGRASNLFGRILVRCRQWRLGSQTTPPPSLPLLAVTVLAATRMRDDGKYSANNFYARAARLLGIDSQVIADEFDAVVGMWRDLDGWLRSHGGRRGVSTILPHPRLTKIGYSLSQALLRDVDRRCLARFFKWANVAPRTDVPAAELVRMLGVWSQRRNGVSKGLQRLLASGDESGLLGELLVAEARAWDGTVDDDRGASQQLRLRLVLRPATKSLHWAAQSAEPHEALSIDWGGRRAAFRPTGSGRFLVCSERSVEPAELARSFVLKAPDVSLRFSDRPVMPFRREPEVGGWVSTDELNFHEDQLLAVCDTEWEAVSSFLELLLPQPLPAPVTPGGKPLLAGFHVVKVPAAAVDIEGFDSDNTPESMQAIRPRSRTERVALSGGLPLRPGLGQPTYLLGGTPDIELPAKPGEPRSVTANLNGVPSTLRATGTPLPLTGLASAPGEYQFCADGVTLQFRILDEQGSGRLVAPESGRIGWAVSAGQVAHQADAEEGEGAAVYGAALPLVTVTANQGRRRIATEDCRTIFIFGEHAGEMQRFDVSDDMPYSSLFGTAFPQHVDIDLTFVPKWIVRDWALPGAEPKAWAKPITLAQKPELPPSKPTQQQIKQWRAELKRLSSASARDDWQRFVLRSWHNSYA